MKIYNVLKDFNFFNKCRILNFLFISKIPGKMYHGFHKNSKHAAQLFSTLIIIRNVT